tara:strand:- start:1571 stop:2737 length:1167 start_codon:yes stop_codon:yes gene_type:complete
MITVLWLDDEYNDPEMEQFAIEAANEGFYLEGYRSGEKGFSVLEKNLRRFDLILLDGLFYEKEEQEKGTEDEKGIGYAIEKIQSLKHKKKFPWFVLSGKDKFTKEDNSLLKAFKAKCYDKTNPKDVVKLYEDMMEAAKSQTDFQNKVKYEKLLEICLDDLLGADNYSRLFELIKLIESNSNIKGEYMLTAIRQIIEGLFETLGKFQILPNEMIGTKGWINRSSLFLAGKHNDYDYKDEIVPSLISFNIYKLLEISQDGTHAYSGLDLNVDRYIKNSQSDYFIRSNIYLLFDILLWFKEHIKNNQDVELNKKKWNLIKEDGDWISGKVTKIENGYGTFTPDYQKKNISIPPNMVSDNNININDVISVKTKEVIKDGQHKTFIDTIRNSK